MHLDDPCMPSLPLSARSYFLACYAVSLIHGESILGITIQSQTVSNYLKAAAQFFTQRQLPDPRHQGKNYCNLILSTLKKYESEPNRRNMVTDAMMSWLFKSASIKSPDSIEQAVFDWTVLGRYAGFRKSEWCQSSQTAFEQILEWPGQPPLAFIPADFEFFQAGEVAYSSITDITPRNVVSVKVRWRKQKNNNNGEQITFFRDDTNPTYCPVMAALRIFHRALRLNVKPNQPIGVRKNNKGSLIYITDSAVTRLFRQAACAAHNLPPTSKDICRWSSHSLRVTAANLLHRAGFSDSFIQKRLRWKSTSFLQYLRNTFYSAAMHTKGLSLSDSNLPPHMERNLRVPEPHERLLLTMTAGAA